MLPIRESPHSSTGSFGSSGRCSFSQASARVAVGSARVGPVHVVLVIGEPLLEARPAPVRLVEEAEIEGVRVEPVQPGHDDKPDHHMAARSAGLDLVTQPPVWYGGASVGTPPSIRPIT